MRCSAWILSLIVVGSLFGCTQQHRARVRPPLLAPPEKKELHTGRLFIELSGYTENRQCSAPPGWRKLCYERVQDAVSGALESVLWASFPDVSVRGHADDLAPGDYLLMISVALETVPPGAHGAGWSTGIKGEYRLVRDGMPVTEARFESRSRAEFAYGRMLGLAAGEVIAAVAAHVGQVVAEVPEPHRIVQQPLPLVVIKPLPAGPPENISVPVSPTTAPTATSPARHIATIRDP